MKQLLFVTTELFAPGGIQRLGWDITKALKETGAPLEVWSLLDRASSRAPEGSPRATAGDTLRLAGGSRLKLGLWASQRAVASCANLDVLLMHLNLTPIAVPMLMRGASVSIMLNGVEAWRPLSAVERWVVERSRRLIAISHYTAHRFAKENPWLQPNRIEVCWLGVEPLEPFEPFEPFEPLEPLEPVALCVSRMSREDSYKGHERLIRLWGDVVREVPGARLVFVGDGDDRARLEALASDLRVRDAIDFAGSVSEEALADWYRRCSIFVLPSEGEGFGLVFLEAMRAGKACIAAPGAPAEIVHDGTTGYVVPPADAQALTHAIVRLLKDQDLRDRFGRNGRVRFEQTFTSGHFLDRLRQIVIGPLPRADVA